MVSLESLLGKAITVRDVMFKLLYALKDLRWTITCGTYKQMMNYKRYEGYFEKMIERDAR